MKILYSQILHFVPGLKAQVEPARKASRNDAGGSGKTDIHGICNGFTLIGHMVDGLSEVKYLDKPDYLISLEIRQNRADCLSVIGLAREIASYYGLDTELPVANSRVKSGELKINVRADKAVKRIMALKFENLENGQSPDWLKELLVLFDINPINLLVDLSNYVMILTGYPSHLLDADKMSGQLAWSINDKFDSITTLDGTQIKLNKNEVILEDDENILALAGVVGGKTAEIDAKSTNVIAEMAIYDRALIRRNARDLHIMTEASNRLEKDLDPNGIEFAMTLLEQMILENCKGNKIGEFSYNPNPRSVEEIEFTPANASRFAGVEIIPEQAIKILKDLRFEVANKSGKFLVKAPTDRMDIELEEDVIEEVIRIYGYDKIPFEQVPDLQVVPNITPITVKLADRVRDIMVGRGYDEVLSWPLTDERTNSQVKDEDWDPIRTVSSVNEEFPELRTSVATGLLNQLDAYKKMNVPIVKIFEIGKIFGKSNGKYVEKETIGMLWQTDRKDLQSFKFDLETLLRSLGIFDIRYTQTKFASKIANPRSAWNLICQNQDAGMIYKLRSSNTKEHTYFAEVDLSTIAGILAKLEVAPAVAELTQKLVTLDANVVLKKEENIEEYLDRIRDEVEANKIWDLWVADAFPSGENIKYTIRVSYLEMSDEQAKKIHLEAFGLKN